MAASLLFQQAAAMDGKAKLVTVVTALTPWHIALSIWVAAPCDSHYVRKWFLLIHIEMYDFGVCVYLSTFSVYMGARC